MSTDDDRLLVERAQTGDQDAFGTLVKRYRDEIKGRVFAMLYQLPKDQRDAETQDIVQETFIKAWKRLNSFRYEGPKAVLNWLTAIATHSAVDAIRKKRGMPVVLDETEGIESQLRERGLNSLGEAEEIGYLHEKIGPVLASLDYDCRILLIASMAYGIAPVEIARMSRASLEPPEESTGMASAIREWFTELIGPLERQMKERRDHCKDLLFKRIRESGPSGTKMGTKKESRGGTVQPS